MNRHRFRPMRYPMMILVAATLYLSLSGFECASTQVTTARVALQRKDFKAAEDALKKEVAERPLNGEAWKLLGDVYYTQGKFAEMDKAFVGALAATTPPVKEDDKKDIAIKRYNAWLATYNGALELYNQAIKANSPQAYQNALSKIDTAMMLRPGYPENLFIRSAILGGLDRNDEITRAYTEYIAAIGSDVSQGTALGLTLGMTPAQVDAKLGKATRQKINDTLGGYSYYEPKNVYVYYAVDQQSNQLEVQGWRFFTEPVPPFIAETSTPLRSTPYYILGVEAYREGESNKARYNDALKYLQTLQQLEPQREGIGQLISEIYVTSGRTAEAKASYEQQIRENPNNPALHIAYGNLLFEVKDYQKSADAFMKVTQLGLPSGDDNLRIALFNLGAVYKNLGADLQDSIRDVTTVPTAAQIELYRKPLRESAKYFEQLRASGQQKDYKLLTELGNLYDVLGEKEKVQQVLTQLEGLQTENAGDAQYWSTMSRFYAIIGDVKKAEMADQKATDLMR